VFMHCLVVFMRCSVVFTSCFAVFMHSFLLFFYFLARYFSWQCLFYNLYRVSRRSRSGILLPIFKFANCLSYANAIYDVLLLYRLGYEGTLLGYGFDYYGMAYRLYLL